MTRSQFGERARQVPCLREYTRASGVELRIPWKKAHRLPEVGIRPVELAHVTVDSRAGEVEQRGLLRRSREPDCLGAVGDGAGELAARRPHRPAGRESGGAARVETERLTALGKCLGAITLVQVHLRQAGVRVGKRRGEPDRLGKVRERGVKVMRVHVKEPSSCAPALRSGRGEPPR